MIWLQLLGIYIFIGFVLAIIHYIRERSMGWGANTNDMVMIVFAWPLILFFIARDYYISLCAWFRDKLDRIKATWREWRKSREAK